MFGRKMDEISKDETVASCRSHTVVLEPSRPKGVAESRLGSWNELDPCKVQDAAPPYRMRLLAGRCRAGWLMSPP